MTPLLNTPYFLLFLSHTNVIWEDWINIVLASDGFYHGIYSVLLPPFQKCKVQLTLHGLWCTTLTITVLLYTNMHGSNIFFFIYLAEQFYFMCLYTNIIDIQQVKIIVKIVRWKLEKKFESTLYFGKEGVALCEMISMITVPDLFENQTTMAYLYCTV